MDDNLKELLDRIDARVRDVSEKIVRIETISERQQSDWKELKEEISEIRRYQTKNSFRLGDIESTLENAEISNLWDRVDSLNKNVSLLLDHHEHAEDFPNRLLDLEKDMIGVKIKTGFWSGLLGLCAGIGAAVYSWLKHG